MFVEDSDVPANVDYGVINHLGPLHVSVADAALTRYLSRLVAATLPPPVEVVKSDSQHTLGLGRRDHSGGRDRKTSWGAGLGTLSWVPSLPSLTPRSLTPVSGSPSSAIPPSHDAPKRGEDKDKEREKETKGKWVFGMPSLGLGEAMGSVGGVFGLGGTAKSTAARGSAAPEVVTAATVVTASHPERETVSVADAGDSSTLEVYATRRLMADNASVSGGQDGEGANAVSARLPETTLADSASHVSQTSVDVEDLQSAVEPVEEIELGWEKRTVHMPNSSGGERWVTRRLSWIIVSGHVLVVCCPTLT
mgnify:CR=1 FL=1